jgi:16S rRNA (guanine966-N2)-methyltransferase
MRVISGKLGGRKLLSPKGNAIRPTSDRVREALFNILGELQDCTILDLFAGSGAVGIEAISRGADSAVLVDMNLQLARRNVDSLCLRDSIHFQSGDFRLTLKQLDRDFDLIFADPPYKDALTFLDPILAFANKHLADQGQVVIEHPKRTELLDEAHGMERAKQRVYGDTVLSFYVHRDKKEYGI